MKELSFSASPSPLFSLLTSLLLHLTLDFTLDITTFDLTTFDLTTFDKDKEGGSQVYPVSTSCGIL